MSRGAGGGFGIVVDVAVAAAASIEGIVETLVVVFIFEAVVVGMVVEVVGMDCWWWIAGMGVIGVVVTLAGVLVRVARERVRDVPGVFFAVLELHCLGSKYA